MKLIFSLFAITITAGICCSRDMMEPASPLVKEKKAIVTTFAGEGTAAFGEGSLLSAKFHFPEDIIIAPGGTIYITDNLNQRIRMIRNGQVSTYAGSGLFGIIDDNNATAQFKNPFSLTMDGAGNIYTTDENDPRIRILTPAGKVFVRAGLAVDGYTDGHADTSRFRSGNRIVADAAGNIFVADAGNNVIRKVGRDGQVSTIAGTGIAGFREGRADEAQFDYPGAIALDKQGNIYVSDRGNFRIRKIATDGTVSTFAGSGIPGLTDSIAGKAEFSAEMRDMVFDSKGNLYVIDYNKIRKVSTDGIVSTVAGSNEGFKDGNAATAKFNYPAGMAVDASDNLYIADLNNHCIRKITLQ